MIGADFEKIHFELFGLDLVEPMALVTDTVMGALSIYFAYRLKKLNGDHPFYQYWIWFYLIFGFGSLLGGIGHVMYNYWGFVGKIPSWISGPTSVYFLEQAMISVHPNRKSFQTLKILSFWKLMLVLIVFTLILSLVDLSDNPSKGFLPVAINTIVGVSLTAGVLARFYVKKGLTPIYKYFVFGVLVMLPSAFVFLLKINLHPWFDKNDLSHVLMMAGITYFYIGVKKLYAGGFNKDAYL
ncbi:hypothetical protein K6119_02870 [Paracrocinitomix mangrovi]|uniref:DUF6962 family protein n=1 Tax=Paracrocinitomix mangrovi TaxID=2862509 RepID=UPI001C8E1A4F|nr:hypothetical protein [Paracrocinitomix mangrovi]UKN02463.1 hypothetical protein K6119_02870 [Paracrocinitomix mangrovi]